jgi:hypothetical protein
MKDKLRTMISKWVVEDRLTDPQVGYEIRKFYWKEIHSYEHWLNEDDKPQDVLDYMYGGGDDMVIGSARGQNDDVGNIGEELDDIYGPI